MVELGEAFALEGLGHSTGNFLGVGRGGKTGEVICSFSDGTLALYDVHALHCVKTWQLSCSEKLTCAALTCCGKFYAVKNKKEMIIWDEAANWASEFTSVELSEDVLEVHSPPSLTHPLVVLSSGGMVLVKSDGTVTRSQQSAKSSKVRKRIVRSIITTWQDKDILVTIRSTSQADSYVLEGFSLANDSVILTGSANLPAKEFGTLSSCFIADTWLYTQWSARAICRSDILPFLTTSDGPASRDAHPLLLCPLLSMSASSIAMARINDDYFATISSQDDQILLNVHDCKYVTEHASLTTQDTAPTNMLFFCEGFLFFPSRTCLSGCSITCKESSLATSLGRLVKNTSDSDSKEIVPNSTQWPGCSESDSCIDVNQFVGSLLDSSKTAAEIEAMCSPFLQDPSYLLHPAMLPHLPGVVRTLTDSRGKECSQTLVSLVESRTLPSRLSDELIQHALSNRCWPLVVSVLENMEGISEERIVELLAAALKLPVESNGTIGGQSQATREKLLCLVLSLPHNNSLLHRPLSLLPMGDVMDLLEYLCSKITFEHLLHPQDSPLSYASTLEWVGLLLDTHFTSLSLVPEAGSQFAAISTVVKKQVKFLSLLTFVEEFCTMSKQNFASNKRARISGGNDRKQLAVCKSNPLSHRNWQYKVDSLDINF